MAIAPGQLIGNYRVLSRLGVGGMGVVYLAEHPIIGKKVALKVIHRELAANREVIGRFYQEARAVNLIGNEHIVEVHDFGQSAEGDHFFIMEYLDGKTLAQVLTRERLLDVGRALHVSAQIAQALQAAHTAGIIHRDLKPDNVMLCERGGDPDFVKLLDFGLAKMAAEGGLKNLTAAGVILGTPQYMSPEACESKKVDHRTDIYALGVLLFQMLCGQVPFDADTMGGVLIKQVTQPPPAPRGLSSMIPPAVEQIILRCLAKSPDARFQTMQELYAALCDPDRYLGGAPASMPAAQPSAAAQAKTSFAVGTNAAMGYAATAGFPAYETQSRNRDAVAAALAAQQQAAGPRITGAGQAQQATAIIEQPGGQGATLIGVLAAAAPPTAPRRSTSVPIAVPQNQTLVIATPPGHSRHPPRRGLGVALGVAAAVIAAVVIAVVVLGGGGDGAGGDSPAAAPIDAAPAVAVVEPDAAPAIDAAPAPVAMAEVTITSEPSDATIYDADGTPLGITPATLTLPADGVARTFTLRRAGRKPREKVIAVTGDMVVTVLLDVDTGGGSGHKPDKRSGDNDPAGSGSGSERNDIMEPTLR
ncbi:MAG: serine/threonine protein kinase [Myxococcales bacterium]|nr:serine/threonine protein kinase [Myxococcales bacterium]